MDFGAMVQLVARPIFTMNRTRFSFSTGSVPGCPRQRGRYVGVGCAAEAGLHRSKSLAFGEQLCVNFKVRLRFQKRYPA